MTSSFSIVTYSITSFYQQKIIERLSSEQTKADDKVMYIQALGNAGSTEAKEKLKEILENREHDSRIRVECVWALRRILPADREKVSYIGPCVREYWNFNLLCFTYKETNYRLNWLNKCQLKIFALPTLHNTWRNRKLQETVEHLFIAFSTRNLKQKEAR